jgi:hypothetical protein
MLATRTTNQYKYYSLANGHCYGGIPYEIRSKAKEDNVEGNEEEFLIVEVSLLKEYPIENQLYPEGFSHDNYDHYEINYNHKNVIE